MAHAFYNEIDPYAAQWLRNLIAEGVIAPGIVDERDIRDVKPDDLKGFAQCHFFAGIGVWSFGLRQAGWSDDREVWTGSCPCQPFSAAGRGAGFTDERHLWPAFFHLIKQRRPETVFGEQVASKDGLAWLDLVHADLEGADYAIGAFDLSAASVGAPHIRQRLFFVGHTERVGAGWNARAGVGAEKGTPVRAVGDDARSSGSVLRVADAGSGGRREQPTEPTTTRERTCRHADIRCGNGGVANPEGFGLLGRQDDEDSRRRQRASGQGRATGELEHPERTGLEGHGGHGDEGRQSGRIGTLARGSAPEAGAVVRPGPTNGFWRDADWLGCTDGKWRPAQPGSQPLAPRSSFDLGSNGPFAGKSRAKMLKGYGNAIVAPLAIEFIRAAMECLP